MEEHDKGSLGWLKKQAKKDGFDNLSEWNKWKREDLPKKFCSDFAKRSDYDDYLAQIRGFENRFEMYKKIYEDKKAHILYYKQICRWENGTCSPQWLNGNCTGYLGIEIGERIVGRFVIPILIGNIAKEMPYGYPGYDFITINNVRIDVKTACLRGEKLAFNIDYNNKPDKFLLVGFDNKKSLNIIHVWLFSATDKLRNRTLWNRASFTITNKPEILKNFKKYEVTSVIKFDELQLVINATK